MIRLKKLKESVPCRNLTVKKSLKYNRSAKLMERIGKVVNCMNTEALLIKDYETRKDKPEGR